LLHEFTLIRSKRKTIAIHIYDGTVEVRAPMRVPKYEIDKFVASKEKWINKNLNRSRQQTSNKENFNLDYGDIVYILGEPRIITARESKLPGLDEGRFYIPTGKTPEQIKKFCVKTYRVIAEQYLASRVNIFADQLSVKPGNIKINGAKTRWGSCSVNKNINFSWRLIMADEDTIDYVVVHELAHLIEMNHSKKFWSIVESIIPNYKSCRQQLKKLQLRLNNENWD